MHLQATLSLDDYLKEQFMMSLKHLIIYRDTEEMKELCSLYERKLTFRTDTVGVLAIKLSYQIV